MGLNETLSIDLIAAGLSSMIFSIDGPNQEIASRIRAGTDFRKVINNIKSFVRISSSSESVSAAVFSAVSKDSAPYLKQLIEVASQIGIQALMLTDLNFRQNIKQTLWKNMDDNILSLLRSAVIYAFSKKLPVLSVHGLEGFGIEKDYRNFLLLSPKQLCQRSEKHRYCLSPWQTIPVDVNGNVTICDCQPESVIGNLITQPLSEIWNGETMVKYRQRMLGPDPPDNCKICPRF